MQTEVIDALAAYRITRLLRQDTVAPAEKFRELIREHGPDWSVELIDCPWCLGFWVSAGVVIARRVFPRAWAITAAVAATSAGVGIVTTGVELAQARLEGD